MIGERWSNFALLSAEQQLRESLDYNTTITDFAEIKARKTKLVE